MSLDRKKIILNRRVGQIQFVHIDFTSNQTEGQGGEPEETIEKRSEEENRNTAMKEMKYPLGIGNFHVGLQPVTYQ